MINSKNIRSLFDIFRNSYNGQWLFVTKHVERIADYMANICEQIIHVSR